MKFTAVWGMVLVLVMACSHIDSQNSELLIGEWVQVLPAHSKIVQGFQLMKNGKAVSINMATLQYETWKLQDNKLVLQGKSIGNHQVIDFTDAWKIVELSSSSLILERADKYQLQYVKQNESEVKNVEGIVRIGHEVRSFQDNRDCKEYWLVDKSGKLVRKYKNIIGTEDVHYQPVFARLKVKNIGKMSEGFGAEYDGAYEVIEIEDLSKDSFNSQSSCFDKLR